MKPYKLEKLVQLNNKLAETSGSNFQVFARTLLSSVECEQSSELLPLVNRGDWNAVLACAERFATAEYRSPAEHRLNVQLASVFRKYPYPAGWLNTNPREKALQTFVASEHKCKRVNQRFIAYRKVRSPNERALSRARSFISYVLGDLRLEDIWEHCQFGAGASIGVHGDATNLARKLLSDDWTVTPGAYYYARAAMKDDIHLVELLAEQNNNGIFCVDPEAFNRAFEKKARLVDYNNITFVPKTALTERTIAVEPLLNGYLQKGVDQVLRKKLKRVGIDLRYQEPNQELSREGSLHWQEPDAWATIDLSSASDSMSIELCRFLLPPEWFDFLNSLRSPCYRLDGVVKRYHKFASMGNGFCFPLETLLFASLCHAAACESNQKPEFKVYGDDIIVRNGVFTPLLSLLTVCGFRVNPRKTFSTGPFRESCGADWFFGEDVRPIILDYAFDSLENIFKFCNIARSKDAWECIFYESLEFLESLIPSTLKFVRPYCGDADSCLTVPWDVFMASPFARYRAVPSPNQRVPWLQCWTWEELVHKPVPDTSVRDFAGYNVALMKGALTGADPRSPFSLRFTSHTKIRRLAYDGGYSTFEVPRDPSDWMVPVDPKARFLRMRALIRHPS